jgi:hypothetical protein
MLPFAYDSLQLHSLSSIQVHAVAPDPTAILILLVPLVRCYSHFAVEGKGLDTGEG